MEAIMPKARIVETDSGIEGETTVAIYDTMQRKLRDRGWIETNDIIQSGITEGLALEVGPGPGYLGLEWLKNTEGTKLKGLDISADMIAAAERTAKEYGLTSRVEYVRSNGNKMPFPNTMFDAVFTNGSLHEWADPKNTMNEIWRVLKPGGRIFISDLRRDMFVLMKWFLYVVTKPKEIRPGLISSINAAYTPDELRELIKDTKLASCKVSGNLIGVKLTGKK
jgi:ubiquinone/menaquinone biosynthesis C-methylase UbiE